MWFWLLSAIAGSIIGGATDSWFRETKLGIWFYKLKPLSNPVWHVWQFYPYPPPRTMQSAPSPAPAPPAAAEEPRQRPPR